MAHLTPPDLCVLHGLRVKGFAETDVLAELVALPDPEVVGHLERFGAEGLVQRRDGRLSGWSLTAEGRTVAEQRVGADLDGAGVRDQVASTYRDFLALNGDLLAVCTAWQMKDGGSVPNDHTDEHYDHKVVQQLVDLHNEVEPVAQQLGVLLARCGRYTGRLHGALAKVLEGQGDFFAGPLVDSYHTVWFQLHEDLLATLGIDRGSEAT